MNTLKRTLITVQLFTPSRANLHLVTWEGYEYQKDAYSYIVADRRLLRNYRLKACRKKLNICSSVQRRDNLSEDFLFIPIPINSTFYAWLIATKWKIKLSVIPN